MAYVTYREKTVVPLHLAFLYPHPGNTIPGWQALGAAFGLVLISWIILRPARRYPYLLVGWIWFLGTLVAGIMIAALGSAWRGSRSAVGAMR